ncbi:MAG: YcgJ family protein [Plesiomonas sp.]|uniref:YcgJ family protein n=1 Tax=Plesiomonas sp. TaxID=2486279 RepID=UPI003F40804D
MNPFTVLIVIAIGIGALYEAVQQILPDIFIPEQGIVCDRVVNFCASKEGVSAQHSLHYFNRVINKDSLFDAAGSAPTGDQTRPISKNLEPTRNIQFSNGVICNLDNQHCEPLSERATYIEVNLFSIGH